MFLSLSEENADIGALGELSVVYVGTIEVLGVFRGL